MNHEQLIAAVKDWQAADPDPTTQAEVSELLQQQEYTALQERFSQRLVFGTAGLRGLRGAGPNRMNRLLVRITTAALGQVLLERVDNAAKRGVVVGFDARHLSKEMAHDTCSVLAGMGIRVHFLATAQPTPLAAFALLQVQAAASIVLTASHNPPQYNGYKVFWDNGAQIIPPIDAEILAAMDQVDPQSIPWLEQDQTRQQNLLSELGAEIEQQYLDAIRFPSSPHTATPLNIVYTAMHGVAGDLTLRAFAQQHFQPNIVAEQFQPDGDFPTVEFPNPEEPKPLALAIEQAKAKQADIILANDPDGDRLAVVARNTDQWQQLNGDQIGWLLADHILSSQTPPPGGFVMATLVSSRLLEKIAEYYEVQFVQTLTGLKWVWNRALELEQTGGRFLFGYEEAIGYSVCREVHDKDGISAAVLFAELTRNAAAAGKTVFDLLDDLYCRVGYAITSQISLTLPGQEGAERIASTLERLRDNPPAQLGSQAVSAVLDLVQKQKTSLTNGDKQPIDLPASNVIQLELESGGRVSIRPSGTEPKLKIYLESYAKVPPSATLTEVKHNTQSALSELERAVQNLL